MRLRKTFLYQVVTEGKETIATETKFDKVVGDTLDNESIYRLWKLNKLVFEELLLAITYGTSSERIAFNLVDTCITTDDPGRNSMLVWGRLTTTYQPKTAPSYIQLKIDFDNSNLLPVPVETRPVEQMPTLESIHTRMNKVITTGKSDLTEIYLSVRIVSNLPEGYKMMVSELDKQLKITPHLIEPGRSTAWTEQQLQLYSKNRKPRGKMWPWKSSGRNSKVLVWKCGKHGHSSEDCYKNKAG